jgi:hypothetical protein
MTEQLQMGFVLWLDLFDRNSGSWSLLYSLGMYSTESTDSNSSFIFVCVYVSVVAFIWQLLSHYLVTGMFTELFLSNGCLLWLSADMPQYFKDTNDKLGKSSLPPSLSKTLIISCA